MRILTWLQYPKKIFILCLVSLTFWGFASGYVFQSYRLAVLEREVLDQIAQIEVEIKVLKVQLARYQDRDYILKQAVENLGLAAENDLIFMFPQ